MKRTLAIMFDLLLFVSLSQGQTATGVPPFSAIAGGPDQINLGNLNVHFAVPVFSKPGRGIPFSYTLAYDSSVWSNNGVNWQPAANWGWAGQTQVVTGYVTYTTRINRCFDGYRYWYNYTMYIFHRYVDNLGVGHRIVAAVWDIPANCNDSSNSNATVSVDGYSIYVDTAPSATVTEKSGRVINVPVTSSSAAGIITDTNGNQVNVNGVGGFTDTLGTTALSISGANPQNFNFTNTSGGTSTVAVNYGAYTVQTNFGCGGINEYGPTSVSLVSSIGLPDGSSYNFTYEQTPGVPGNYTGRIASIQLPTGGTISYAYTGGNNGIVCADGTAAGFNRNTPDGPIAYSRSNLGGSEWVTSVTDPYNNLTQIWFQSAGTDPMNFYETKRQVNQYANGVQNLVRQVWTCYNGAGADCSATTITPPVAQTTVITQLDNGVQSRTDTFLNGYLLPTEVDEYDFGGGAPGGLLRKTITTYNTGLSNSIVDRVANVQVQDSGSNLIAYTTYGYDETGLTPTSGIPQHVAIYGSRGNMTSVNQWLNTTGGYLTTSMAYDDTGNVLSATDPGSHTTSIQYANANAYVGVVTMPDSYSPNYAHHTTSATYDSNTGLPLTTTDQNGNQTSYHYDGMLRTTEIDYPDGGGTTYYYPNPTQVETQRKINSSTWKPTWTEFDSLGRFSRQEVWNGQGGNSWDQSVTCYDAMGRTSYQAYTFQDAGWSYGKNCNFAGDHFTMTP